MLTVPPDSYVSELGVDRLNSNRRVCAGLAVPRDPHESGVRARPPRVFDAVKRCGQTSSPVSDAHLDSPRRTAITAEYPESGDASRSSTSNTSGFVGLADDGPRELVTARRDGNARYAWSHDAGVFPKARPLASPGTMNFSCARWSERLARVDRDARLCQQPRRAPPVCCILAAHLPGQRDHPADVAACDRAPRHGPERTMTPGERN